MYNFSNKKSQKLVAKIVAGLIAFAMVIGLLVTSLG